MTCHEDEVWRLEIETPAYAVGVPNCEDTGGEIIYFEILPPDPSWKLDPGDLYIKAYSKNLDGKEGVMHQSHILGLLSEYEFSGAQATGWPTLSDFFYFIFGNPNWEIHSVPEHGVQYHTLRYLPKDWSHSVFPVIYTPPRADN